MTSNNKNKIVIIETICAHGGMELYDYGICEALAKNNCEVILFTSKKLNSYQHKGRFKIKCFFAGMYNNSGKLYQGSRFLSGLIKSILKINSFKPNIIYLHVFHFSLVELLILIPNLFFKIKIFINIHDPISFGSNKNSLIRKIYGRLLLNKNVVISTHSEYSKKIITSFFPKKSPIIMPHFDVDFIYDQKVTKVNARKTLKLNLNYDYVLFFGHIKDVKGLDLLLHAWKNVSSEHKKAKLLIVGRAWKSDLLKYKQYILNNNLGNSVIWKDSYIEAHKVPLYFRASDLIVLPYKRIYSSGVLLRAMGYSTPLLVSNLEAFKEIIIHRKNGYIFNRENESDLELKILTILRNKNHAKMVSRESKKWIDKNTALDVIGKKMVDIFNL